MDTEAANVSPEEHEKQTPDTDGAQEPGQIDEPDPDHEPEPESEP